MFKRAASVFFFFLIFTLQQGFCGSEAVEYLCDFGIAAYKSGNYNDALTEFKKALIVDPNNQTAQTYMNLIFQQELQAEPAVSVSEAAVALPAAEVSAPAAAPQEAAPVAAEKDGRDDAMDQALSSLVKKEEAPAAITPEWLAAENIPDAEAEQEKEKIKVGPVLVSGDVQLRAGAASQEFLWKRANWDMNERNWRNLSHNGLNRGFNTYDARVYDRLALNVDTDYKQGLNFHTNIVADPWSYIGKSDKISLKGADGDVVQVQLKYWGNNGYTINQAVTTSEDGDVVNVPEMKVVGGKTQGDVAVTTTASNVFVLPQMKLNKVFQPMRELWVDYVQDNLKVRAYPLAYENQALSFDDPLKLSGNRIWWEDSPWIRAWQAGNINRGLSPVDFTKGYWDNALSAFARDSEGRRLVGLRGAAAEFRPLEGTSIEAAAAAPMSPWQDYADVDNFASALRVKQTVQENLRLGFSGATRTGHNLDNAGKLDAFNYVLGGDLRYEVMDGLLASLEFARSQAKYDMSESDYQTKANGNAYYFSLVGRFPFDKIIDTKYGYDGIQAGETESNFHKFRFFAGRMDKSFEAPLSSYVETRDDEWWGRHLHFRKPFKDYYQGEGELLGWQDVKNFAIGNGIDIGRSVLGLRVESEIFDKTIINLFDIRNVNTTNYSFLENVARDQTTWRIGERLTTKFLGIYHLLPKTDAGIDPYIFNPLTRDYYTNTVIEGGKDPSVGMGSLGAEYAFFDWLALNGIWEYTNDISYGLDNYPRRLLNEKNYSSVFYENGNKYREELKYLYDQGFFPKPPYPYSNVFKAGLRINPLENMELYLDWTRNPFEKAGFIDDNMNHVGFQMSYNPMPKLGLFFRYTYSRWQDLDKLIAGINKIFGHHNFFGEIVYRVSGDEDFTLQYGEGGRNPFMGGSLAYNWDPYGGSLNTIDTPHVIRVYYRRKF